MKPCFFYSDKCESHNQRLSTVKKTLTVFWAVIPLFCLLLMVVRPNERAHQINLPTSKTLTVPVPGFIARTNSYPTTIALSPDGRYAALLNQGYGTEQSAVRQSIAILDLSNNQLRAFPDDAYRTAPSAFASPLRLFWQMVN
jgi:hypothetical protein